MKNNMNPFVKWAGGKRQIVDKILEIIHSFEDEIDNKYTFIEPFVGGGAVFIALNHNDVIINDINTELINAYEVIRDEPDKLMKKLDIYKKEFLEDRHHFYYNLRGLDRDSKTYNEKTALEKAARTIFLNKTCFNGLYRVNLKGQFNTPMGRYKNPSMYKKENIEALSKYFNKDTFKIFNKDYSEIIEMAKSNDIIYVDPPYDYGPENDGFTQYQKEGFVFDDFILLKKTLDEAIHKGAFVIISNNATDRVINLFREDSKYKIIYNVEKFKTNRNINSKGNERKTGLEVLIIGKPITFPQANDVDKVMSLIRLRNPKILKDNSELERILRVSTYRQIQYYTTALRFLELLSPDNEYTEKAIEFRKMKRIMFEYEFAKYILTFEPFKTIYYIETNENKKMTNIELSYHLGKHYKSLSQTTLERRSSTIRKWIEFCKSKLSN